MRKNRIIGAKYLPTFYGEWQRGIPYAPLTMVTYRGDSYISKKEVPVNIDISNNGYWERTGQYNAQLENYIRQVRRNAKEIENARKGYPTLLDFNNYVIELIQNFNKSSMMIISTDVTEINKLLKEYTRLGFKCVFPFKSKIIVDKTIIIPSNCIVDFNHSTVKRKEGLSNIFNIVDVKNADNVVIENLLIDGNKNIDNLTPTNETHRFSGLRIYNSSTIKCNNIEIINTVNGEDRQEVGPASGLWVVDSHNVNLNYINAHNNDRTGIMFTRSKNITLDNAILYNNVGSGVSSSFADRCKYLNIVAYNNGYTNVSVNGEECIIDNIDTYNSLYSGLTIGHENSPSDNTQVSNIITHENTLDGISIGGSSYVNIINVECYKNKNHGIRINQGAKAISLTNVNSHDNDNMGLLIETGISHILSNLNVYNNGKSGLSLSQPTGGNVCNSNIYNNGQIESNNSSGLVFARCINKWSVNDCSIFDNQSSKTQENGIWCVATTELLLKTNSIYGNKIINIKRSENPNVYIIHVPSTLHIENIEGKGSLSYSRDSNGKVLLNLNLTDSGSASSIIFQLPVGFRPFSQIQPLVLMDGINIGFVTIGVDGTIKPSSSNKPMKGSIVFTVPESTI